jgi:hypothetical protein
VEEFPGNSPLGWGCKGFLGLIVVRITHSTAREGCDSKGSSRSVVRVDRRANSETTVRRVLLPEIYTVQPENKPFPSNKLDTYQREYCGSFGSNG